MSLGEKLYQLRTQKNLSQGDLAEKLDVSRQSVSKWENDMAVPDLDKLIKLCNVFEISLDELTGREKVAEKIVSVTPQSSSLTHTKIVGYVLLGITIPCAIISLIFAPAALLLCIPLTICTVICFKVKKYAWYWCIWAVYLMIQVLLDWSMIPYIPHIIEAVFMIIMTVITYRHIKELRFNFRKQKRLFLFALCIIYAITYAIGIWIVFYLLEISLVFGIIYAPVNLILTMLLGAGMIYSVCYIRQAKQKK